MGKKSAKSIHTNYKSRRTLKTNFTNYQDFYSKEAIQVKKFNLHSNTSDDNNVHKMINAIEKASDLEVPTFWKAQIGWRGVYHSSLKKCLRNELFAFVYDDKNRSQNIIRIIPKQTYHKLFENNCEYFVDIIRSLTQQLVKIKDKIITNNLNLDNIYLMEEKDIRIGEWGCSAIKRVLDIGGKHVELTDDPVLNDSSGWMINP